MWRAQVAWEMHVSSSREGERAGIERSSSVTHAVTAAANPAKVTQVLFFQQLPTWVLLGHIHRLAGAPAAFLCHNTQGGLVGDINPIGQCLKGLLVCVAGLVFTLQGGLQGTCARVATHNIGTGLQQGQQGSPARCFW
jgi:hypothetical protein